MARECGYLQRTAQHSTHAKYYLQSIFCKVTRAQERTAEPSRVKRGVGPTLTTITSSHHHIITISAGSDSTSGKLQRASPPPPRLSVNVTFSTYPYLQISTSQQQRNIRHTRCSLAQCTANRQERRRCHTTPSHGKLDKLSELGSRDELGVLRPPEVLQVFEEPEEGPIVQVPTLRQI